MREELSRVSVVLPQNEFMVLDLSVNVRVKGCKALQILIFFYFIYFCTICRLFIDKFVRKELNKQFLAIKYYNLGGACSTGCSNSHKSSNFEEIKKEVLFFISSPSIVLKHIFFSFTEGS